MHSKTMRMSLSQYPILVIRSQAKYIHFMNIICLQGIQQLQHLKSLDKLVLHQVMHLDSQCPIDPDIPRVKSYWKSWATKSIWTYQLLGDIRKFEPWLKLKYGKRILCTYLQTVLQICHNERTQRRKGTDSVVTSWTQIQFFLPQTYIISVSYKTGLFHKLIIQVKSWT